MRISDWSSDVCSSDLAAPPSVPHVATNGDLESPGQLEKPCVDRTAKHYIGGKQARPDGGYSRRVLGADGTLLGEVAQGNRKDIRNAVEAAQKQIGRASCRERVCQYV